MVVVVRRRSEEGGASPNLTLARHRKHRHARYCSLQLCLLGVHAAPFSAARRVCHLHLHLKHRVHPPLPLTLREAREVQTWAVAALSSLHACSRLQGNGKWHKHHRWLHKHAIGGCTWLHKHRWLRALTNTG